MISFITAVKNFLDEQGKSLNILFENNIISKNTFYKYNQRYPSLTSLINIANFLEVSIDYLFELSEENNFNRYSKDKNIFYTNLLTFIKTNHITAREFCRKLNYAKDNLIRWRNGTSPSLQTLFEISNFFNCSVDDLLLE